MKKRDLIFLDQMIRKLASPYFVENDFMSMIVFNGPQRHKR
jgi:hypothetical protein